MGKTAYLYPNADITETYTPFVGAYLAEEGYAGDTVVTVDVADGRLFPTGFDRPVDAAIDHHPNGGGFAPLVLLNSDKASCGEIILGLAEHMGLEIDSETASLLYIAVSTDTGCFRYANTKADTFRAAAMLTDRGADIPAINKLLFRTKSRERIKLEGFISAGLTSLRGGQLNIALVTLEMLEKSGAKEKDCEDLAGIPGSVAGSRVSITVRELAIGKCKISLRTDGVVNATEVCARFGGGGHRMASGCEIDAGPQEAADRIRAVVEELWP